MLVLLISVTNSLLAQSVGLVLSGGGGTGLAHIGVIKALEENGVPIDHITGSSIGSLVGGLYAAGFSPAEIDSLFSSETFLTMAEGRIEDKFKYYFKQEDSDGSWLTMKLDLDTSLQSSLPTNLRSPALMDFEQMRGLSPVAAVSGYNMDSLFVPFRCVASNITKKEQRVFRTGDLAKAVRASISYPFWFKPIRVDGDLMMDGGLYNNFPADVMYDEFFPDIIIGSNVGYSSAEPSEDDLLSQLRAMLVEKTDYSIPCENGIIIQPEEVNSTFDFTTPKAQIDAGYRATIARMPEILQAIHRRKLPQVLEQERQAFRGKENMLVFQHIEVEGLSSTQRKNVERTLRKKELPYSVDQLKPFYFNLLADRNVSGILPTAILDTVTGMYNLSLEVKRDKNLELRFGGLLSTRPVSTGFAALRYNMFDKASSFIEANSYFGKFYTSAQLRYKLDISGSRPVSIEPAFTFNRYDHFNSFESFFLDERPSFVILRDIWAGIRATTPLGNKGMLAADGKWAFVQNDYYQSDQFTNQDTTDVTEFVHITTGVTAERNSLNRKQHASEGELFRFSMRYFNGEESTIPGSTSPNLSEASQFHSWLEAKVRLEKYFLKRSAIKFGMLAEGVYSGLPFFSNFKATVIQAPAFRPTPEIRGYFIEELRAQQYLAGGFRMLLEPKKNIDFRFEGYVFQPWQGLISSDGEADAGPIVEDRYFIASGSAVYHSPVGPMWFNTSYLDGLREPWVFSLNFGYFLYNRSYAE